MFPLRLFNASALALSLALPTVPAFASMTPSIADGITTFATDADTLLVEVKQGRSGTGKRGRDRGRDDDDDRGRGRGSDDGAKRGGGSGSGRDRPRIPGGSGCDSPRDLLEHPECTVGGTRATPSANPGSGSGRDRPRIPGGSGCDDPRDLIEHPECRL